MEQEKFLNITVKTDSYNGITIDLHYIPDEIRSELTVDSFDTIIKGNYFIVRLFDDDEFLY